MAYLITDATGQISIADEERDTSTSLVLVGRHYSNWGEYYAQNFLNLLTNFASAEAERPTDARQGQLWYDTVAKKLFVFRGNSEWFEVGSESTRWVDDLTLTLGGDLSGTVSFNGSEGDVTLNATLKPTSVTPGIYNTPAITVDQKGRITSITNNGGDGTGVQSAVEKITFQNPSGQNGDPKVGPVTILDDDIIFALGFTPLDASAYVAPGGAQDLTPYLMLNGSRAMTGALNMGNREIINVSPPQAPSSAVRKADLDAVSSTKTLRKFQGQNDLEYNVTVSTAAPSGGVDGDVWYRY